MPPRRPSASAAQISSVAPSTSNGVRTHRSNGSHHGLGSISLQSFQPQAPAQFSHQQKIIQVLVGRLWTNLPTNSGTDLPQVENERAVEETIQCLFELSKDSLDVIAIALTDLLEKVAKPDANGVRTVDELQSQLFILKVLSICMASRWNREVSETRPPSRTGKPNAPSAFAGIPDSPGPSARDSKRSRQTSSEHLSTPPGWSEPPPLDDHCAKYLLSVMVAFLRQTAPPEGRLMSSANLSFEATVHDFESIEVEEGPPVPSDFFDDEMQGNGNGTNGHAPGAGSKLPKINRATSFPAMSSHSGGGSALSESFAPIPQLNSKFEKTHKALSRSHFSLNALILKFAGRIIYHLSASNWTVVLQRIRNKIRFLASSTDDQPDFIDLYLMKHSALDRTRLAQILQEMSSLLVNMNHEAKVALAVPLRTAVWNWIDLFPEEYNEALRSHRRLEAAPERVFDLLYDSTTSENATARALWPTLAVLSCVSPERIRSDNREGRILAKSNVHRLIAQLLKTAQIPGKLRDVAIVCILDLCRGAARARPEGELPLRSLAGDLVHEIKSILLTYDVKVVQEKEKEKEKKEIKRPFWESQEEIDVAMFGDALVALHRFSATKDALQFFHTCLEPERSDAVKLVAVKACITLTVEMRNISWQPKLTELQNAVAGRLRSIFKHGGVRRNEVDSAGNLRRASTRPKAKRFTAETVSDRELLLIAVLHAWKVSPGWLFSGLMEDEITEWVPMALSVWEQQMDTSIQYSIASSMSISMSQVDQMRPSDPMYMSGEAWRLVITPAAMRTVANALLNSRLELDKQRMWAEIGHTMIKTYVREVAPNSVVDAVKKSEDRVPALSLLELASLASMTSADSQVSRMSAHTLRLIAIAERQPGAPQISTITEDDRGRRYPIYEQIGDPRARVTGRLAWQKRCRRLVSSMAVPHPFFIAVWEECYYRWCALTELVIRAPVEGLESDDGHLATGDKSLTVEERRHQWKNLTLWLASCGAVCLEEQHDPYGLQKLIPAELLPDAMRVLKDPRELITNFITYLIDLLLTESVMARETAKEALGSELSFRLHGKLLKHLDDVIQDITRGEKLEWSDQFAIFLDQFIAVLKLLSENTQSKDEVITVDVTPTLFALAGFINHFSEPESYRVRIRFCQLCDSLFSRLDMLSMRKEGNLRQHVLDILLEWIKDPTLVEEEEGMRVQQDVNLVSLRAAVHFVDRLELRSLDGSGGGDESSHVASRLFIRYSNLIMRALDYVRPPSDDGISETSAFSQRRSPDAGLEVRELVIKGLSRLVSANTDSGVKHSLALAYDPDPTKKVIFTQIFSRVMGQGTTFDAPETVTPVIARSRLPELIKGPDMTIALAICETCPANEVDIIIPVLLNVFNTRESLMNLMKALIDREIAATENEAQLFRGNSTCTRTLSAFARIHGYTYLRGIIVPLIKAMEATPDGLSYVLDPAKVSEKQREENQKNVEFVAGSFLKIISSSVPALPSMFRELCQHIGRAVNEVWPEAKFAALGAFIFLRFISPAVVAPDIIDVEIPRDKFSVIRKGLMMIAKIIQNLANNIFFGKEAHMASLNRFLEVNIVVVTHFLSDINRYNPAVVDNEEDEWSGTAFDDTDTVVLHRFFDKHADKVGKELLSTSRPSAEGDASAINGKRAWDAICAALVELGAPIEIPRMSNLASTQHQDFLDLMSRYRHRNLPAVGEIFVETFTEKKENAVFVLFVSKIDVETLDIDLLLFHIFKTLTSPAYSSRIFDIIFDWTSFTSTSQVPMQWLKYCIEMVPYDVRERFDNAYILNANAAAHQYLRRAYNVTAGLNLSSHVQACSSIEELLQYVPATCVAPLVYATSLEQEQCEQFMHIMMRQTHSLRTPVTMEIGMSHLRILSEKAQPVSPGLGCKPIEIIPFVDISDVYNVTSTHDASEFIIRKTRQSVTMYFSTPMRDQIVKAIRAAKGRMRSISLPGTERFSRLSNVSAALLHIAMLNLGFNNNELRAASHELLASVIASFNLDTVPMLSVKGLWHGASASPVIVMLSDKIAVSVPHLTLDFLSEVCSAMDKADPELRLHCLAYMSPWLKNLAFFVDPTSPCHDVSGAKLRDCIRLLIDLTLDDPKVIILTQKCIWAEIGKLDTNIVNVVLDELMRAAIDSGVTSQRCDTICLLMMPLSSINVRGQLLSKMRKALGKTSVKPTKNLADNSHWNEIASLSRLALSASQQQQGKQAILGQFYLPELMHMITLIAATGETLVRTTVWGLVMDSLHSLWAARASDAIAGSEIKSLHDEGSTDETLKYFGLCRAPWTGELIPYDPKTDKEALDNQEGLTLFLIRVMEAAAQTKGLLNVWRARWMSLVTATAFQVSPAVQVRAFVVLGALATSDVDDDFFYQMLVAFKTALSQFNESDTISVVSMLRCLRSVASALLPQSRYLPQIFWLAVSLLQSAHIALYAEAANLLRVTIEMLFAQGLLGSRGIATSLLEYRAPMEDIAVQLDQLLGLSFDSNEKFSFSLAAIIFKGVRLNFLRGTAVDVLRSLLRISSRATPESNIRNEGPGSAIVPDALGFFLALLPASTMPSSYRQLLIDANADAYWLLEEDDFEDEDQHVPRVPLGLLGISDFNTALLVVSFLRTMILSIQGDDAETEILFSLLADVSMAFPEVLALTYDGLQDKVKDMFATSSTPAVLSAASYIFHVALQDPMRSTAYGISTSTLATVEESTANGLGRNHQLALEEFGMNGLANPLTFIPANKPAAARVINWISELVLRIIE